jgi:transcriptional regulator with XRE-family HTH domain
VDLVQLIAFRIRELRLRHSLTQEEAAELVGVSMRYYQMIEAGRKKEMFLGTVQALARAFGLEAWQLIGPDFFSQSKPRLDVAKSAIHSRRPRRGPHQRSQRKAP